MAELILELLAPGIDVSGGLRRATADARVVYQPPMGSGARGVASRRFSFVAPLGPIETEEIAWYLERYPQWPSGFFEDRAREVEGKLAAWGQLLAEPLLGATARDAFETWNRLPPEVGRRFSVLVDDDPGAGSDEEKTRAVREGATLLLGLPWELLHDDDGFLFQGAQPVRVRRRLPNRKSMAPLVTAAPIRVLVVSPRPEDERAVYIDHRVSARPLVAALEALGEKASEITLLAPPTKAALEAELLLAREPWAVILGEGGEGKTTLAAELARWLVATRRFRRAAFVSMEHCLDVRSALFALGEQLVAGFVSQAAQDETLPWQLVERALHEEPTIVVFDNMESVLPAAAGSAAVEVFEPQVLAAILELGRQLVRTGATRVVFTSREALPEPFAANKNTVRIGRLERREAIELVGQVLGEGAWMPQVADQGESDEEVANLVDAVGCHARSLVLLAREVAASGVRRATEQLGELMAALAAKHPHDRERSLFASVELSLRRLPEAMRRQLPRLAVFQGGGHGWVIAQVLGLAYAKDEEVALGHQLSGVGLAEWLPYGHLRLHPALAPALDRELSAEERADARQAWVEAMVQLTGFLDQQRSKDAQQAATLTLLELPNLLGALERLAETADAERVVDVATRLERLLQNLGRPKTLARAAAIRTAASQRLGEWSHGRFQAESAAIDRLIDAGRFAEAVEAAGKSVQRGLAAGETAYSGAAYDLAMAHFTLGRALERSGAAEAALAPLTEARNRFRKLAEAGGAGAARMASVSLTETGDCLMLLGRLDEAAHAYEAAIELAKARNDPRSVAVNKNQLGTVRRLQRRFGEALAAHTEAREIVEQLGEPGSVAVAWHSIGIVHQDAGQHEAAEHAYQQSLKLEVQRGSRSGEADTLNQLGGLYAAMGRLEAAVRFLRQAAEIAVELGDLAKEGMRRSNIAFQLIKLQRYNEARQEIERAIKCKEPYGHAALPWTTFNILHDLERAVGNEAAAAEARERALQAFLAYRRAGGANHSGGGRLAAAVAQALATEQTAEIAAQLAELREWPELPDYLKPMIPALQAILAGSRDPALAADPALHYTDAAEILLLLEGQEGDHRGSPLP